MGDLKHWINFNMSDEVGWNNEVDWKNYWAIACHCLWYWRNKELYDDSFMRPASPTTHVLKLVKDIKMLIKLVELLLVRIGKWSLLVGNHLRMVGLS